MAPPPPRLFGAAPRGVSSARASAPPRPRFSPARSLELRRGSALLLLLSLVLFPALAVSSSASVAPADYSDDLFCAYYGDSDCPSFLSFATQTLAVGVRACRTYSSLAFRSVFSLLSRLPFLEAPGGGAGAGARMLHVVLSVFATVLFLLLLSQIFWRYRVHHYNKAGSQGLIPKSLHQWEPFSSSSSPRYCSVCRQLISGFLIYRNTGWACSLCQRYAHTKCLRLAERLDCKTPCLPAPTPHVFIQGNLAAEATCCCCGLACSSNFGLDGLRCLWCNRTLHEECRHRLPSPLCDLGAFRQLILPPSAVSLSFSLLSSNRGLLRVASSLWGRLGVKEVMKEGFKEGLREVQEGVRKFNETIVQPLKKSLKFEQKTHAGEKKTPHTAKAAGAACAPESGKWKAREAEAPSQNAPEEGGAVAAATPEDKGKTGKRKTAREKAKDEKKGGHEKKATAEEARVGEETKHAPKNDSAHEGKPPAAQRGVKENEPAAGDRGLSKIDRESQAPGETAPPDLGSLGDAHTLSCSGACSSLESTDRLRAASAPAGSTVSETPTAPSSVEAPCARAGKGAAKERKQQRKAAAAQGDAESVGDEAAAGSGAREGETRRAAAVHSGDATASPSPGARAPRRCGGSGEETGSEAAARDASRQACSTEEEDAEEEKASSEPAKLTLSFARSDGDEGAERARRGGGEGSRCVANKKTQMPLKAASRKTSVGGGKARRGETSSRTQMMYTVAKVMPPKASVWRLKSNPSLWFAEAHATPLLVFVNVKSGGQTGKSIYKDLVAVLNPLQVIDIQAEGGPTRALTFFRPLALTKRLRVLVCGGDGTVGWIIDSIHKVYGTKAETEPSEAAEQTEEDRGACASETGSGALDSAAEGDTARSADETCSRTTASPHAPAAGAGAPPEGAPSPRAPQKAGETAKRSTRRRREGSLSGKNETNNGASDLSSLVPVGICPLGTGNDLSNVLGWGFSFDGDIMKHLLKIQSAVSSTLDLWKVKVVSDKNAPLVETTFSNYLDVGVAARIVLKFHKLREENPELFQSRLGNKFLYGEVGFRDFLVTPNIALRGLKIFCDGEEVPLPYLEGVCVVNIPSFAGGVELWDTCPDSVFSTTSRSPGRLSPLASHRHSSHDLSVSLAAEHGLPLSLASKKLLKQSVSSASLACEVFAARASQESRSALGRSPRGRGAGNSLEMVRLSSSPSYSSSSSSFSFPQPAGALKAAPDLSSSSSSASLSSSYTTGQLATAGRSPGPSPSPLSLLPRRPFSATAKATAEACVSSPFGAPGPGMRRRDEDGVDCEAAQGAVIGHCCCCGAKISLTSSSSSPSGSASAFSLSSSLLSTACSAPGPHAGLSRGRDERGGDRRGTAAPRQDLQSPVPFSSSSFSTAGRVSGSQPSLPLSLYSPHPFSAPALRRGDSAPLRLDAERLGRRREGWGATAIDGAEAERSATGPCKEAETRGGGEEAREGAATAHRESKSRHIRRKETVSFQSRSSSSSFAGEPAATTGEDTATSDEEETAERMRTRALRQELRRTCSSSSISDFPLSPASSSLILSSDPRDHAKAPEISAMRLRRRCFSAEPRAGRRRGRDEVQTVAQGGERRIKSAGGLHAARREKKNGMLCCGVCCGCSSLGVPAGVCCAAPEGAVEDERRRAKKERRKSAFASSGGARGEAGGRQGEAATTRRREERSALFASGGDTASGEDEGDLETRAEKKAMRFRPASARTARPSSELYGGVGGLFGGPDREREAAEQAPLPAGDKLLHHANHASTNGNARARWRQQSINDQLIEVVGFKSLFHLGQVQVGLAKPVRICQGRELKLILPQEVPLQIDGEPTMLQANTTMHITWNAETPVLLASDKSAERQTLATVQQVNFCENFCVSAVFCLQVLATAYSRGLLNDYQFAQLAKEFQKRF
ncbi:hypothetical protein BESB_082100 [Besnoitia besnoiti]|uniref:Diacylglycerol kinase n=1 Tax=Besnoitia besnoiti TaxID=94643 RepID=A0A2A9M9M0_BESBE|nr:hypothetical protein BESB_082100 [Besnoitia besnoiti]PFH33011.1 hypothetical protein BESB_082100 [Besnoitia besnoiti]